MSAEYWTTVTIQKLIEDGVIIAHKDGNHGSNYPRTSEFGDDGVPFLTAKLLDEAGNIDLKNAPRLSNKKADKFKFGFIETNDVLLSHNATVGRVAVVPKVNERVLIGTSLTHYRLDETRLLPKYLAAYFSGVPFQNQLASVMSQTTRNQVPITSQRKLSVVVPPIGEQKRIADVLGVFDDKIRTNRQINQTLEGMAQAVFKSWFVDFEPTRAKIAAKVNGQDPEQAAMTVISGKTVEQLNTLPFEQIETLKSTAALFPETLESSELGELPDGWDVGTLNDLCDLNKLSWTKKNAPTEVLYVDLANTKYGVIEDVQYYSWEDAPSRAKRILSAGDVIVGTVRPGNRSFALIGDTQEQLTASTGFAVLSPKKTAYIGFLYIASVSDKNIDRLAHLADGGAYPAVRPDVVTAMDIALPPDIIIERFNEVVSVLFEKRNANLNSEKALKEIRDTLLPKLLSGELEVSNAH